MAYIDKCCASCGIYQELIEIGRYWDKSIQDYITEYKRFEILNVCKDCTIFYRGQGFTLENAKLHKIPDKVVKQIWEYGWYREERYENYILRRGWCGVRYGKTYPKLYCLDLDFAEAFVHASDKRKLRRGLRKLGCRGKIEKLIK